MRRLRIGTPALLLLLAVSGWASSPVEEGVRLPSSFLQPRRSLQWAKTRTSLQHEPVSFKLFLRECGLDRLEEVATAVSQPGHELYRKHLRTDELRSLVACPDRDLHVQRIQHWLRKGGREDLMAVDVRSSFVEVTTTVAHAKALFGEGEGEDDLLFETYTHQTQQELEVVRAAKPPLLPREVRDSVDLVVGLHELPTDRKYKAIAIGGPTDRSASSGGAGPRAASQRGLRRAVGTDPQLMLNHTSETIVSPRVVHHLYNMPPARASSGRMMGRQGVVEFDDYFAESDVCLASNLLADAAHWLATPDISYHGQPSAGYNSSKDTAEATMDVEIMVTVAGGVPTDVVSMGPCDWVLDWAALVNDAHTPDHGGPLVWSVSYGWPEAAQASLTGPDSDNAAYLRRTNAELMKLAALGVTVLVSSGDDGSPGYSYTCPTDPNLPILGERCPLGDGGCKCSDFILEKVMDDGLLHSCIFPTGLMYGDVYPEGRAGRDCALLLNDTDCNLAMVGFNLLEDDGLARMNGCRYAFSEGGLAYSDCECGSTGVIVQIGTCTIRGYTYEAERFGSAFAPDFPASSPWVTSVGATQVAADPSSACMQGEVLTGHDREVPVVLYNAGGGFSEAFDMPAWQRHAVEGYLRQGKAPPSSTFNASRRAYPDVSALGWYYLVIDQGRPSYMGGTSASAPAMAALISRLNHDLLSSGHAPVGFLNPLLYHLASHRPEAFNKVRSRAYLGTTFFTSEWSPSNADLNAQQFGGSNNMTSEYTCRFGFQASDDGWDPVTGLGTPNYGVWRDFLLSERTADAQGGSAAIAQSVVVGGRQLSASSSASPFFSDRWLRLAQGHGWRAHALGLSLGLLLVILCRMLLRWRGQKTVPGASDARNVHGSGGERPRLKSLLQPRLPQATEREAQGSKADREVPEGERSSEQPGSRHHRQAAVRMMPPW